MEFHSFNFQTLGRMTQWHQSGTNLWAELFQHDPGGLMTLGRQLAAQRPDAFLPDLARSLGAMGRIHQNADAPAAAVACFAEGIELMAPRLAVVPQTFAPLTGALARNYLQACEAASQEPDQQLLQPVVEVFARLQEDGEEG